MAVDWSGIGNLFSATAAGIEGRLPAYMEAQRRQQAQQTLLDEQRKQAMAVDFRKVRHHLESGDTGLAQTLLQNRLDAIGRLGGDPTESAHILRQIQEGDIPDAIDNLNFADQLAVSQGIIGAEERAPETEIGKLHRYRESLPEGDSRRDDVNAIIRQKTTSAGSKPNFFVDQESGGLFMVDSAGNASKINLPGTDFRKPDSQELLVGLQARMIQMQLDEKQAKSEADRQAIIEVKNIRHAEATNAIRLANDLLGDGRYKLAFGKYTSEIPDLLRSQNAIDAIAQRDQLVSLLTLESRQKLKGQGAITEGESKQLGQSATVLATPNISDPLAEREIKRVRSIFEEAAKRNTLNPETPREVAGGYVLPSGDPVTREDIEFSARQNGKTVEQVIQELGIQRANNAP